MATNRVAVGAREDLLAKSWGIEIEVHCEPIAAVTKRMRTDDFAGLPATRKLDRAMYCEILL